VLCQHRARAPLTQVVRVQEKHMAIPTYKDIVELIKKGATVEAQERIMELREAVLELQEENVALKQKNRELEEALKLKGELHFDGAVYWQNENNNRVGPFCPQCLDVDENLVRLQNYNDAWYCTKHRQPYNKQSGR
jgi:hypothetical protein